MGGRITGPQFQSPFKVLLRLCKVPFAVEGDKRARIVGVGEVGVELQRPIGCCNRLGAHFLRGNELGPCSS